MSQRDREIKWTQDRVAEWQKLVAVLTGDGTPRSGQEAVARIEQLREALDLYPNAHLT